VTRPRLHSYFSVDLPPFSDPTRAAADLRKWPSVEYAYVEPLLGRPPSAAPDFENQQRYRGPAKDGIEVADAWSHGGDGTNVALVDIERGWSLSHPDLKPGIMLVSGGNEKEFADHGTATLGVVVGLDNGEWGVGIVPNARSVMVVGQRSAEVDSAGNEVFSDLPLATAIVSAIYAPGLERGDVVLLETQVSARGQYNLPIEVDEASLQALLTAAAYGLVVVEAAGNGSHDLDRIKNEAGVFVLSRSAGAIDSGAIMVAAAEPIHPRGRKNASNYGSRIDLHAWGDQVATITTKRDGTTPSWTQGWNGTSSASAIVAGAALAVQSMLKANGRSALEPRQLRDLLVQTGTRPTAQGTDPERIGSMPNLKNVAATLGIS
jgi:hypothetical protein